MLSPDDRTLLVDLLAPPEGGYRLERAVATTFTLHLTALLPVPLAFAGADLGSSPDPLGVLQSVRNYADRIDVFCQAGHVAVPAQRNDLLAFLEPMVHQVRAPSPGHLFHPKLWVLRYVGDDQDERYRLVCGSRNLTHDRAWDTVLCLDGYRTATAKSVNRPAVDFLRSLAPRVPGGVDPERRRGIDDLAEGLHFVEWERPDGVVDERNWLRFHVLGSGRRARPNMDGNRRMVVSPFVNEEGLEAVWPDGACVLVSRAAELDALGDEGRGWFKDAGEAWMLDETAAIPDPDSDEAGLRWSLSGLHAKYYVVERARRAHVFIGSANATEAAWGGNDEVLVELIGRVRSFGVNATLGEPDGKDRQGGLVRILVPHIFGARVDEPPDVELARALENALRDLASLTFTVTVEGDRESPILWVGSKEPISLTSSLPDETELTVSLVTTPHQVHRPAWGARLDHRFHVGAVEDITSFLVLRLAGRVGSTSVEVSTVVLGRLVGDPADRLDRLLARRIGSPAEFLRFVLLLLHLAGREDWTPELGGMGGTFGRFMVGSDTAGLLEAVVLALAANPAAIDDIDRLVARLEATEQGRQLLPLEWPAFWSRVVEAHRRVVEIA